VAALSLGGLRARVPLPEAVVPPAEALLRAHALLAQLLAPAAADLIQVHVSVGSAGEAASWQLLDVALPSLSPSVREAIDDALVVAAAAWRAAAATTIQSLVRGGLARSVVRRLRDAQRILRRVPHGELARAARTVRRDEAGVDDERVVQSVWVSHSLVGGGAVDVPAALEAQFELRTFNVTRDEWEPPVRGVQLADLFAGRLPEGLGRRASLGTRALMESAAERYQRDMAAACDRWSDGPSPRSDGSGRWRSAASEAASVESAAPWMVGTWPPLLRGPELSPGAASGPAIGGGGDGGGRARRPAGAPRTPRRRPENATDASESVSE
jgi:hypothetical protein